MTVAGKDLLNMDFKIRPRRYIFVGAGTKFTYTRDANMNEKITAPGPLKEAIQLLVSCHTVELTVFACTKIDEAKLL